MDGNQEYLAWIGTDYSEKIE